MDMLQVAHLHVKQAQDHYKKYADMKRHLVHFWEGEQVYLYVPKRSKKLTTYLVPKCLPRFYRSFKILKKVGQVAYKLQLLPSSSVHHVSHVNRLHKHLFPRENKVDDTVLVEYVKPPTQPHEPKKVLDYHDLHTRHQVHRQALIK